MENNSDCEKLNLSIHIMLIVQYLLLAGSTLQQRRNTDV